MANDYSFRFKIVSDAILALDTYYQGLNITIASLRKDNNNFLKKDLKLLFESGWNKPFEKDNELVETLNKIKKARTKEDKAELFLKLDTIYRERHEWLQSFEGASAYFTDYEWPE